MEVFYISALRGEAALKARLPKEARKNAAISPYETNSEAAVYKPQVAHGSPCVGELLQLTPKGKIIYCLRFIEKGLD